MPSIYSIPLEGVDFGDVHRSQVHAVLSRFLGHGTSTWSLVHIPEHVAGSAELRVGVLTNSTRAALLHNLTQGTELTFGPSHGDQIATISANPVRVRSASWTDLATPYPSGVYADSWQVTFHSPAAISLGNRNFPLLSGDALILSLLKKWQGLERVRDEEMREVARNGHSLPSLETCALFDLARRHWDRAARMNLRIVDLRGHTEVEYISRHTATVPVPHYLPSTIRTEEKVVREVIPGFVGVIRLMAFDPDLAALTDCLLRFGEFTGVGAATSYGFGSMTSIPCLSSHG